MKRFELKESIDLPNIYLRHGIPNHLIPKLHRGRFILDERNQIPWGPTFVRLDDGDWNEYTITFHSTKHAHIINADDLEKLREVG